MSKRYSLIYADPPWSYGNTISNGAAADHYSTMRLVDLKRLPVWEVAAENAVLAMWYTGTHNQEAIELAEAWGFTVRTMKGFTWVKLNQLPRQAFMTGWPTPTTSNTRSPSVDAAMNMHRQDGSKTQQRLQDFAGITGPLRLTVFGEMRTGSFVEMGNGVQLNPAHSRWLMGLPHAWDESSPGWQEWQAATASAA
ncbi:MT-A70 family methyltransferase [Raoultella ornithinolytica]|uniref:MT-A70 family methyltransferase n=1 Tax=Raoultella ornithinolytica TaxID=54291 RepID=UPI001F3EEA23|nr:MT-A70 family methyltransferase [Raoultella ornithinolytica]